MRFGENNVLGPEYIDIQQFLVGLEGEREGGLAGGRGVAWSI